MGNLIKVQIRAKGLWADWNEQSRFKKALKEIEKLETGKLVEQSSQGKIQSFTYDVNHQAFGTAKINLVLSKHFESQQIQITSPLLSKEAEQSITAKEVKSSAVNQQIDQSKSRSGFEATM